MGAELPEIGQQDFARGLRDAVARLTHRDQDAAAPRVLTERSDACADALWRHYQELRRWNRRTSLVGPGTAGEAWSRHYGEALAAVPLLVDEVVGSRPALPHPGPSAEPSPAPQAFSRPTLLDLGSGAGFPGFVLAAALPELDVTLVDARERKWAFLRHAARRAGVDCRCLQLRVDLPLPDELPAQIHVLTLRALKLPPEVMAQLVRRMPPGARLLSWQSGTEPLIPPPPPLADWPAAASPPPDTPSGDTPPKPALSKPAPSIDSAEVADSSPRFRPGRVIPLPGSDRRFLVELVREA